MQTNLTLLQEMGMLKRALAKSEGAIPIDTLEKDFLFFSRYSPKPALQVVFPKLHTVREEKTTQLREALTALAPFGTYKGEVPEAIDIAGEFSYLQGQNVHQKQDAVIFLSLEQFRADHFSGVRSYLNPLVEKIYSDGAPLLRDFTLHETVLGVVQASRGDLHLREVPLFPERFTPGSYQLSVELDTPSRTIRTFRDLALFLQKAQEKPQEIMLQRKLIAEKTREALALRKVLGSLSRYQQPKETIFSVDTNSCIVQQEKSTLFYLYAAGQRRNVVVYFGENPFSEGKTPEHLDVLSGEEHQKTLATLVSRGIYHASEEMLRQRMHDFQQLSDTVRREMGKYHQSEYFSSLVWALEKAEDHFSRTINTEMRRKYLEQIDPELLEFMISPTSDDIVLYQLLPRLSWKRSMRFYHNTLAFMAAFSEAEKQGKRELLQNITENLLFSSQQNYDLNRWLYTAHRQFCLDEGVVFAVEEK